MGSVCEKRVGCASGTVSFATSMEDPEKWQAYKESASCKEEASTARRATRDAAVGKFLQASKASEKSKAGVAKAKNDLKVAKESATEAGTALAAAKEA